MPELDLRGVVLDTTTRFLNASPEGFDIQRDPGFVPVMQLSYLLGRPIPIAVGPFEPLRREGDTGSDRIPAEQSGIEMLLSILRTSSEPVVISMVGSARVLAAAFNREPELLRSRTRAILMNAGSTAKTKNTKTFSSRFALTITSSTNGNTNAKPMWWKKSWATSADGTRTRQSTTRRLRNC